MRMMAVSLVSSPRIRVRVRVRLRVTMRVSVSEGDGGCRGSGHLALLMPPRVMTDTLPKRSVLGVRGGVCVVGVRSLFGARGGATGGVCVWWRHDRHLVEEVGVAVVESRVQRLVQHTLRRRHERELLHRHEVGEGGVEV